MSEYKDQFGTPLEVGDTIAFSASWNNGNTRLYKATITSFTKGKNPRVMKRNWSFRTFEGGEVDQNYTETALTGKYVKTFDDNRGVDARANSYYGTLYL